MGRYECNVMYLAAPSVSIGVTESSVENLDTDLSILRRRHLNVLDGQWLVGFPGHRGFTMKTVRFSDSRVNDNNKERERR